MARVHVEMAGLLRGSSEDLGFRSEQRLSSTATGRGGSINANVALTQAVASGEQQFLGRCGGRYLFGQAPDVVVRADGKSVADGQFGRGFNEGFELTVKKWLWYSYYGNIYVERAQLLDANGKTPIGYGYSGSPNSQNRSVNDVTFGFNDSLWKDARYGALSWMGQYEYLTRDPWYVAAGAPKGTHDNAIYFDLRYTLPGSMPKF